MKTLRFRTIQNKNNTWNEHAQYFNQSKIICKEQLSLTSLNIKIIGTVTGRIKYDKIQLWYQIFNLYFQFFCTSIEEILAGI